MASARRRRGHHRVQLPRRGVVVERGDRAGVRRHPGVEAVGAHAADRDGLPGTRRRAATMSARRARSCRLILGGREVGERWSTTRGWRCVSATGSVRMGQQVGPRVAQRFGRVLLELGGNNAAIVTPSADLELAVRGIVFSAAGTAGQRCTTLRRLIVHVPSPTRSSSESRPPTAACRSATRVPTARWSGR